MVVEGVIGGGVLAQQGGDVVGGVAELSADGTGGAEVDESAVVAVIGCGGVDVVVQGDDVGAGGGGYGDLVEGVKHGGSSLLVTGGAPVSAAASWTVGWGGSTPQRPRRDGAGFSACASRARQRLRRVGRAEKVTRPVQFGAGVG